MKPTIIHGPQGCGKTSRATEIKAAFGAQRVVDDWRPGIALVPGDIALTNCEPPFGVAASVVPFGEVVNGLC
ncbi:hypothetical protein [uncultured Zhongshania sp.]|mgnify:CR=1 FL=1|uniref:hypothetical protein n=1 Tax=uncultured Zhongshania sp. TaxID=1642288 RepID=UPI0030D7A9B1